MGPPSMTLSKSWRHVHLFFCIANSKHHRHGASWQPFVLSLANARRLDQLLQDLPQQHWNGHTVQNSTLRASEQQLAKFAKPTADVFGINYGYNCRWTPSKQN